MRVQDAKNAVWLFQTNDERPSPAQAREREQTLRRLTICCRNRAFLPATRRADLPNGRLRRCGSLMWNDHTALPIFSAFYALWVLVPFGYAYGHSAGLRQPE